MKESLLETAIVHFGRYGFEGAATRAIAQEANTAMSSITYHFGGKEGLYLACADHIAAQVLAKFEPFMDDIRSHRPEDREAAMDALVQMLRIFATIMLAPSSAYWSSFMIREQSTPTAAFDRLFDGAIGRVMECVVELIHIARPDLDHAHARACAIGFWGQALILRTGHASVCRVMGVESIDSATADSLVEQFVANTRCVLSAQPEHTT